MRYSKIDSMPPSVRAAVERQTGMKSELDMKIQKHSDKEAARIERELQRECETRLVFENISYVHLVRDVKRFPNKPDLMFAINGYPIAVELKAEKKELNEKQKEERAKMVLNGWHYYWVNNYFAFSQLIDYYRRQPNLNKITERAKI